MTIRPITHITIANTPIPINWKKPNFCYFIICSIELFLFVNDYKCLS